MKIVNPLLHIALLGLFPSSVSAQYNRILSHDIASLQVVAGDNWLSMPIARLDGDEKINISFDDLTHEYHRYVYKLEHCDAFWNPSTEIFSSDFCQGFADGNTIDDVEQSINTNTLYTHYSLQIPNERCRPIMSGNYRVSVYDDNTNDTAFVATFMLYEPIVGISLGATTNTDVDINGSHQQVEMKLAYGSLPAIRDYREEITTVVLQNGYWRGAVVNATPQYIMHDGLQWQHNQALIFDAGNEYRKFETLDPDHTTMGLENVGWDGSQYHAYIWPDEARPNYVYDEDANGSFYIRNSDNIENDVSSEYVLVHFTIPIPRQNGDVYLNARWTNESLDTRFKLHYDEIAKCYRSTQLLKQGYYSYQYLLQKSNGDLVPLPTEGNFYQTENKYQSLVYYRPIGRRTHRLVGYSEVQLN